MRKLAFIIPPEVELLDLAGPVQVFTEAKFYGLEVEIEFYQYQQNPISTSGLGLREVEHYKYAHLRESDFVFYARYAFRIYAGRFLKIHI